MTASAAVLPEFNGGDDIRRWSLAAAIVVAAHAGLMAGYVLMPDAQPQGAASSPAIIVDLAPAPVAPASPADLAPGPEMAEALPTQEVVEKKPEVVEPLPKQEQPSDVTMPAEEPKPEEKREQRPSPRTTAAAPLRSELENAPTPRAPSLGSAEARAAMANWRDLVVAHLQRHKRYPGGAEARRAQGVVVLSFSVNRGGQVLSRGIVRSSGHSELDQEVLAMIQRAQPLPAFPPAMTQSQMNLSVPIRFSLR